MKKGDSFTKNLLLRVDPRLTVPQEYCQRQYREGASRTPRGWVARVLVGLVNTYHMKCKKETLFTKNLLSDR